MSALFIGQSVVLVHAFGDLSLVFFMPAFVDLGEGHVEFIVDGDISKAFQCLLGFIAGGVGADANIILSGHPWLCTVAGEFGDAAGAVGALAVLPGSWGLPLAAGGAEDSCFGEISGAFYTIQYFTLPFRGKSASIKGQNVPFVMVGVCLFVRLRGRSLGRTFLFSASG